MLVFHIRMNGGPDGVMGWWFSKERKPRKEHQTNHSGGLKATALVKLGWVGLNWIGLDWIGAAWVRSGRE